MGCAGGALRWAADPGGAVITALWAVAGGALKTATDNRLTARPVSG